jgi:hypothetical protein
MNRTSCKGVAYTSILVLLFACCAPVRPLCHCSVTSHDAFALKCLWASACCDATLGYTWPHLPFPSPRPIKRSKKWRMRESKKLLLDNLHFLRCGEAMARILHMISVVSIMVVVLYDAWGTQSISSNACIHTFLPHDVSLDNSTACIRTLATPRTTWESSTYAMYLARLSYLSTSTPPYIYFRIINLA